MDRVRLTRGGFPAIVWQIGALHVRLEVERVDDEESESDRLFPSVLQLWKMLDQMLGITFRVRRRRAGDL